MTCDRIGDVSSKNCSIRGGLLAWGMSAVSPALDSAGAGSTGTSFMEGGWQHWKIFYGRGLSALRIAGCIGAVSIGYLEQLYALGL